MGGHGPENALAPLGSSSWGEGLAPLSAVFLLTRMGEMTTPQQKTHRAGNYLFVFNLFCHIFVKRQKCNKKYISTVPEDRAMEVGFTGPSDLRLTLTLGPGEPEVDAPPIL